MSLKRGLIGSLLASLVVLAARRWLDVVEVRGRSMSPTLLPGDRLLIARRAPRVGDVVVAADPRDPRRELIKRVANLAAGRITLRGDNSAASTDARTFGPLAVGAVSWRAIARYWPRHRMGWMSPAPVAEGGEPTRASPEALIAGE